LIGAKFVSADYAPLFCFFLNAPFAFKFQVKGLFHSLPFRHFSFFF
jgi:hypothetical protein